VRTGRSVTLGVSLFALSVSARRLSRHHEFTRDQLAAERTLHVTALCDFEFETKSKRRFGALGFRAAAAGSGSGRAARSP